MILKSLQFFLFRVQKLTLDQIVVKFSRKVSFDDIVHFTDEANIVD